MLLKSVSRSSTCEVIGEAGKESISKHMPLNSLYIPSKISVADMMTVVLLGA